MTGCAFAAAVITAVIFVAITPPSGTPLSLFWYTVIVALVAGSITRILISAVDWFWPFDDDDDA